MKTVEEIESYLRGKKVSGVLAVRMRKLIKEFATPDAFFSAKRADIEKMYNRLTPGSKNGIGGKFWTVFDLALDFFNGKEEQEAPVKPCTSFKDGGTAIKDDAHANVIDERDLHMISYNDLKKIVDMMELLEVESINLMEIAGFLRSVRFRQKKNEPENKDGQDNVEDNRG